MSKKNRKQEVVLEPENSAPVVFEEEPTLFEAEAYGSPQPEAGSDVTVMKPVGIGGPVPIVAPKHNTIQLQPIVVPLAVVPYMTQDSGVLRTDARGQQQTEEYAEAAEFTQAQTEKARKAKKKFSARWFVLATFLISAVLVLPFILSYFYESLGALKFVGNDKFNVIGTIAGWISSKSVPTEGLYRDILFIAAAVSTCVLVIVELIALLAGKYPRAFTVIFSLVPMGTSLAVLIIDIVNNNFVANDRVALIVFLALSILNFLLSIVFSVVINHAEDKADRQRYTSEI
ncbi:MAG: hypothetical protein IJ226_04710 [Clostridia bacterium]|nr:hypothetical protein [Clostridia bacterium]